MPQRCHEGMIYSISWGHGDITLKFNNASEGSQQELMRYIILAQKEATQEFWAEGRRQRSCWHAASCVVRSYMPPRSAGSF